MNKVYSDAVDFVSNLIGVAPIEMMEKNRRSELALARHSLAYYMRRHTHLGFKRIGELMVGRHHATVIHAVKSIEDFIKIYPHIQRYYDIADECLINHKQNLIEFYRSPIFTEIERNRALVDILIDNNDKLKSKIKKLKKELDGNEK